MKLKRPIILCFEINEQNFDEVNQSNPSAIPDLEKALVELGPLPAGSHSEGTIVVYCIAIHYSDFAIADILEVFNKFGLRAILKEEDKHE